MITWMQRHKKYLVITIWISVIAFVGAGFVGWGSVDLNITRSNNVAVVGKLGISKKEFQDKFNQLFSMQNQLANGTLTQEQAMKMQLDSQALISLIQSKLLQNYANDLGLIVSNDEVISSIVADENFFGEDKKFSDKTYKELLKNVGLKPSEYEEQVRQTLLINKLFALLDMDVSDEEIAILAASAFMRDEVELAVIDASKDIAVSENEIQEFWQKHKDDYKSTQTYTYNISHLKPKISDDEAKIKEFWQENKFKYKDAEGKIKDYEQASEQAKIDYSLSTMEKEAKLKYINLKNNKENFDETITLESPINEVVKLAQNEISKPIIKDNEYQIIRLEKINKAANLSYEEAKDDAKDDLLDEKRAQILEEKAKSLLAVFKGENIGYISRDSSNKTKLNDIEFYTFLNELFQSDKKENYVILSDKAVLYRILSQKLENSEKLQEHKDAIAKQLKAIKENMMIQDLIKNLSTRYEIKNYYKGNEF